MKSLFGRPILLLLIIVGLLGLGQAIKAKHSNFQPMNYKLQKGESVIVNGVTIQNRGVQSVVSQDQEVKQTSVTLFITPAHGAGKEFGVKINESPGIIKADGLEITIIKADSFSSEDIEFAVAL